MKPLLFITIFVGLTAATVAEEAPFVAGFERFARHGDIDPGTAGGLLLSELSCTACHASSQEQFLAKRGPVLDGAGSRLKADWLRRFILDPSAEKHGTTMPEVLSSIPIQERSHAADALVAFLSSMQQPFLEVKASGLNPVPSEFWNKGNADRGRKLYHQIGCVACHSADAAYDVVAVKPSPLDELLDQLEPDELKEHGLSSAARRFESVPLPKLADKYSSESLTFFLMNPEQTRPSGRMPNFQLQAVDAADLATWLLRTGKEDNLINKNARFDAQPVADSNADAILITKGRELFTQLRCVNCHDVKGMTAQPAAMSYEQLDLTSKRSCIRSIEDSPKSPDASNPEDSARRVGQPVFVVDQLQAQALTAIRDQTRTPDRVHLRLLQHNCYACHERNSLGGVGRDRKSYFETVGSIDIGDEGRLPPTLTGVGKRLTINWMSTVLHGKGTIRPHMTIRMPVFPSEFTEPLPELIASSDGASSKPIAANHVFAKATRAELLNAGRQLMDFGCVQCHSFKGEALPGVVGIDLEGATQRLRADWLHDFLKDPGVLKARTRMPTFFPNGRSQNADVLGGDTELQLAAMHAYLEDLANQPLPAKIVEARSKSYELLPTDRPIILRTFMPNAGTHAIAVGYPQKIHFAFDAENVRLAEIWQGRFLDAEGTWFVRSAPPASPLGDPGFRLPEGPMFAQLENLQTPWPNTANVPTKFGGYRINKSGVPTFLYLVGHLEIAETISVTDDHTLRREIVSKPKHSTPEATDQIWLRISSGLPATASIRTATSIAAGSVRHTLDAPHGLSVCLLRATDLKAVQPSKTRTIEGSMEWLFPMSSTDETSLELEYQW